MTDTISKNILAIDTSTRHLKLALSFGADRMVKSQEVVEKSHGQYLMKKIDQLFQSAGLKIEQLQTIVTCTGPGSFTGLRIGLAASKGIAVALDIPIVGVNLFEVAAFKLGNEDRTVHVIVPLNNDECFLATVKGGCYNEPSLSITAYNDLVSFVGKEWVAGIGVELGEQFPELKHIDVSNQLNYDGSDLLYIGQQKLSAGVIDDLTHLEPLYVRKSVAELKFERRQRNR